MLALHEEVGILLLSENSEQLINRMIQVLFFLPDSVSFYWSSPVVVAVQSLSRVRLFGTVFIILPPSD